MLDKIFAGLFDTEYIAVIDPLDFLICIGVSIILGIIIAATYMYRTRYSKSFVVTLAILPAVVCVVIMMVNGNVGAGVAVAGAFSLVRFRSAPGTAKEIGTIFLAMGAGLIAGMGYLAFAALFTLIICAVLAICNRFDLGTSGNSAKYKVLNVTIPESLNYSGVFESVFEKYASSVTLSRVKTTNMGSMFRLTYNITMKKGASEKEMIDALRERNGNLEISLAAAETAVTEL